MNARTVQHALFDLHPYTLPRPTKQERLQALWDASGNLFEGEIVFRGSRGWWAVPAEFRHFNDEGEYLGSTFDKATSTINWLTRE
jgi:hypothetical protein